MITLNTSWIRKQSIARFEWILQWRSWGTWAVSLFFLALLVSEHPIFWQDGPTPTIGLAASNWSDRTAVIGSMVVALTVPFALHRPRRQDVSLLEFSKPINKAAYVLGKLIGAAMPIMLTVIIGMLIHIGISAIFIFPNADSLLLFSYLKEMVLIVFPPLFFSISVTYCASVFLRSPLAVVPLFLIFLFLTTASQAAADAVFSWISPIVRPEYFNGPVPDEWMNIVIIHQVIYAVFGLILLMVAFIGFRSERFLPSEGDKPHIHKLRLPKFPIFGPKLRMMWGGHVVAGLLFAVGAYLNTISFPDTQVFFRVDYALFGLEFYLSVCGLLLIAGVFAVDKGKRSLDLVLTKPVNRWRLLLDRLWPAVLTFIVVAIVLTLMLHFTFEKLPLLKACIIGISTGFYLGMIGFTVANLTRNPYAGYGFGILFWFFEAGFQGRFTAPVFLLIASHQVDSVAGDIWLNPDLWLPVKIGNLLIAFYLLFLNGWFVDIGKSRRQALIVLIVSIPILILVGWWLVPLTVR